MIEAGNRQQRKQAALARTLARRGLDAGILGLLETDPNQLVRPVYWQRQVVTADDLTAGQDYLRGLLRQHNRLSHGAGVVCGLEVFPAGSAATGQPQVMVTAGYALSPLGDEIYVPEDQTALIDCVPLLGDECLDPGAGPGEQAVYLVIRYDEAPICPTSHYAEPCDPLPACEHQRVRAGFEIRCLSTPPPTLSLDCQAWIDELLRCGPPPSLGNLPPLAICPTDSGSPLVDPEPSEGWVILARLYLDDDGQLAGVDYHVRQRLFSVQFLGRLVRCLASLAPVGGEAGTRFEVYVDRIGEYRWRLVAPGHEIIADSGEGFATRIEVDQELERLKRTASAAPFDDLTRLAPAEQPVDHVWGIGPVYRDRLQGIAIDTVGQLANAQAEAVAAAMDVSRQRAAAFIAAANRLLSS